MGGILYGICGIGNGHAYRQRPIVQALARRHRVVVFAYGDSLTHYQALAERCANLHVVPVTVPYLPGRKGGLDWGAIAYRAAVNGMDPWEINGAAMAEAERLLGRPDLVLSDYEPTAAQYAYATGAPLVTLDQQSKFLVGDLPPVLGDEGQYDALDEIARLRLFFPKAERRLACSFFRVNRLQRPHEEVDLINPVLRPEILDLHRAPGARPSVLVYLSAQQLSRPDVPRLYATLASRPAVDFHVFGRAAVAAQATAVPGNVAVHAPDDALFLKLLGSVHGLIATAGHNLLSEAVHLGIPTLALPISLYEQQLNARMIAESGAGQVSERLTELVLEEFVERLPEYRDNLTAGSLRLMQGTGIDSVLGRIAPWLPASD